MQWLRRRVGTDRAPQRKQDDRELWIGAEGMVMTHDRQVEGYSAFVTVQEGCDKFCTFCVVPYPRAAASALSVDPKTTVTIAVDNDPAFPDMRCNVHEWGYEALLGKWKVPLRGMVPDLSLPEL